MLLDYDLNFKNEWLSKSDYETVLEKIFITVWCITEGVINILTMQ